MSQDNDELQVGKKDRLLELKLAVALNEVECSRVARVEMEQALQFEQDRHQQTQRKHDSDFSRHLESIHKLSQQLGKVEATSMLLQQQIEKRDDKAQLQAEGAWLSQQLAEANEKAMAQEQVMAAMQRRFKDCQSQIQQENRDTVQILEEQNRKLTARNAELQELLEVEQVEKESTLCHMQKVLAEAQLSPKVCTGTCTILNEEKGCLEGDVNWLKGKLQKSDDENVQLKRCLHNLKLSLDDKDRELAVTSDKLQEALSETPNIEQAVLQLVESVQRLAADNARLEEAVKRQTGTIAELQEVAEDALLMKAGLEEQLTQKAQLGQAEEEATLLRGHLQEAQKKAEDKEQEVVDGQKCFSDALGKMRAETLKFSTSNLQLQELLQSERSKTESTVWQLQQELAETKNEVLLCKTSLEVSNNHCSTLDEEKLDMQEYIIRLEGMLKESEDKYVQSEQVKKLINTLRDKDCEVSTSSQMLQDVFSASARIDKTTQHLRESLQQLESENTRLVEAEKQQTSRITEVQVQTEQLMLQQQVEEAQQMPQVEDQSVIDVQDCMNETIAEMQAYKEEKVLLVVDRSKEVVVSENAELQDFIDYKKINSDSSLRQLQKELADMQNKLSLCEESLEETTRRCIDLAVKNQSMPEDMNTLHRMLQESKDKYVQSECFNINLKCSMDDKVAFSQKMQEVVSISTNTDEAMESLQQLEIKTLSLEEAEKQQTCIIMELAEVAEEATRVKKDLEEQLDQEKQGEKLPSINLRVDSSETEAALQNEREKFRMATVLQEALQALLEQVTTEKLMLQQQLREAQKISELRDLAVADMQRCMNDTLTGMQAYSQEKIQFVEKISEVFVFENAELKKQIEHIKTDRDSTLSQQQKELTEMQIKLSLFEELCEDKTSCCRDLEEEKLGVQVDMNTLRRMLQDSKDKYIQLECCNFNMKCTLDDKEREAIALSQKLQETVSSSTDAGKNMMQVESMQWLDSKNLNLEEAAKQQACRTVELKDAVEEATRVKKDLEEQVDQDKQKQNLRSINSQVGTSETEEALQGEMEKFRRAKVLQEALQTHLGQVRIEKLMLQQQLEEAQNMAELKNEAETDLQSCINKKLPGMQAYCKENIDLVKKKEKGLPSENAELQEQVEHIKTERASALNQLQKELTEMRTQLLWHEELLKDKTCCCRDLEEEKLGIQEDLNTLRRMLQQSEDKYIQLERCNFNMKCALEDKEGEVIAFTQLLQEFQSTSTNTDKTIMLETVQLLESENKDRESILKNLQRELDDMQIKLSLCEELLEEKTVWCRDLEEERLGVQEDMTTLRRMLQDSEDKYGQLQHCNFNMKCALKDKEGEVTAFTQMVQEVASTSTDQEHNITLVDGSVQRLESEETDRDCTLRQLLNELADMQTKLSMCEASLQDTTCRCIDLVEEKLSMQKDINMLNGMLQESEDKYIQLENCNFNLKCTLDDKEHEVITSTQKLNEVLSTTTDADNGVMMTIKDFEKQAQREALQPLVENEAMLLCQQLELLECETPEREKELLQLQQELAAMHGLLEIKARKCSDLEGQINMFKRMLEDSEGQKVQLVLCIQNLKSTLDSKVHKVIVTSQKLHRALTACAAMDKIVTQLEECVCQLDAENGKLKATARWQVDSITAGRNTERKDLEDRLNREVQWQALLARREILYVKLEKEKALTEVKSEMEELLQQLEKEAEKCRRLEEENMTLGKQLCSLKALSESYKKMKSRTSQLEGEVTTLRWKVQTKKFY